MSRGPGWQAEYLPPTNISVKPSSEEWGGGGVGWSGVEWGGVGWGGVGRGGAGYREGGRDQRLRMQLCYTITMKL